MKWFGGFGQSWWIAPMERSRLVVLWYHGVGGPRRYAVPQMVSHRKRTGGCLPTTELSVLGSVDWFLLGLIGITVSRIHRLYELFGDLSGLYRICCINSSNEHPRGFNPRGLDFYNFLSEVFRGLKCWLIEDHVLHKDITPIATSPSQITHGHQSNCLFLLYVYLKANCNVLSDEYWGGF